MFKGLFILSGIYLAGVFDSVVSPAIEIRGVSPDLLALAAAMGSLLLRDPRGLVVAGLAGAIADVNSPGRMGVGMAVFAVASVLLSMARRPAWRRPLRQSLLCLPAVAGMTLVVAAVRGLLSASACSAAKLATLSLVAGLYSSAVALPLFCIAGFVANRPNQAREMGGWPS
jgi:rod shape-determining protein MreD